MQCNRCGATLPPGVPTCPYCANPTPYNAGSSPQNMYAPPPPTSYGQQLYAPPPQVPYGQPVMVPIMAQPRKQSGCATAAIIVLVIALVLACGIGGIVIAVQHNNTTQLDNHATATADGATATAYSAQLTPTPYPPYTESNSPSGATFSEAAQQVIPTAQLAGEVDSQNRPVTLQSTFRSDKTIYLSYKWAQGNTGYVQTRWYVNGAMKHKSMSKYINQYAYGYGYFSDGFSTYDTTLQGTIEVFWCQDSACTHGGLAWARPFSVTAS
ncbi:MAG TPA: hypothetical protein VF458_05020 [Ktedonobacteraceae bacterium]